MLELKILARSLPTICLNMRFNYVLSQDGAELDQIMLAGLDRRHLFLVGAALDALALMCLFTPLLASTEL